MKPMIKVPKNSENHHDDHIKGAIVQAVSPYDTKKYNEWKENFIGNFQHLHPHGYEREVEDQQHHRSRRSIRSYSPNRVYEDALYFPAMELNALLRSP
jgi:hypothetical protein